MSEPQGGEESPRLRDFRAAHGELVRAFNEGDFERAFAAVPDDFELFFAPGAGVFEEKIVGRRAIVAWFEEFRRDLPDWGIEPFEYIEVDPLTFVVGNTGSGVGRASGLTADLRFWDVYELDAEDRPLRDRQFFDRDEALAAARSGPSSKGR